MNEHQEWMKPSQYTFYRLRVCVTCMQSIFFPSFSIVNVRGKCTSIDFMCFNWLNVCWIFFLSFISCVWNRFCLIFNPFFVLKRRPNSLIAPLRYYISLFANRWFSRADNWLLYFPTMKWSTSGLTLFTVKLRHVIVLWIVYKFIKTVKFAELNAMKCMELKLRC